MYGRFFIKTMHALVNNSFMKRGSLKKCKENDTDIISEESLFFELSFQGCMYEGRGHHEPASFRLRNPFKI